MDQALIERIRDDMRYEFERTGPPEGFPKFPDIPMALLDKVVRARLAELEGG